MNPEPRYAVTRPWHRRALAVLDALGAAWPAWRGARTMPPAAAVRRLLLVRWQGLGDLVLLLPALERARALFPAAQITLLIHPRYRGFAQSAGLGVELWTPPSAWAALWQRRPRCDAALEFHGELSWIVVARRHARRVAGYGIRGGGFLLDLAVDYPWRPPAAARQLQLVEMAAGVAPSLAAPPPRLALAPAWHDAARGLLPAVASFVVLHPGCGQPAKQWAPERWRALALRCHHRGWEVVLTGAGSDRPLCDWLAATLVRFAPGRMRNLAGRTDWGSLAGVVARAAAVVSSDSGIAHLARALAVPTVTLFGPTDPAVWGGGGGAALAHPPPCGPCQRGRCPLTWGVAPCMAAITVEEATAALEAVARVNPLKMPAAALAALAAHARRA